MHVHSHSNSEKASRRSAILKANSEMTRKSTTSEQQIDGAHIEEDQTRRRKVPKTNALDFVNTHRTLKHERRWRQQVLRMKSHNGDANEAKRGSATARNDRSAAELQRRSRNK